jgi:hypothetical protein
VGFAPLEHPRPDFGRACIPIALLLAAACCGGGNVRRGYPEPRAEEILQHLAGVSQRITSLNAETQSDARIGKDRANVTVLIAAAWGGKLRFMAMNPSGDMAADLASDGSQYCFVDKNKNCGGCGPATPENVARILRIVMPADDVVRFLFGSTPVLENAQAKVSWDAGAGHEVLELTDGAHVQKIVLEGRDRAWDVLLSERKTADGRLQWRVQHKDYHPVGSVRLPGKSLFEEPTDSVLIRWKEQTVNEPIPPNRFQMDVPYVRSLPACP